MATTPVRRAQVELGLRVAELREDRRLTQPELAERAALSPRYMQMIEAGQANITFEALVAVAAALDVEIAQLFVAAARRAARRRRGRPKKLP